MHCPLCQADNRDDAIVCAVCGALLHDGTDAAPETLPPDATLFESTYTIEQVLGYGGFGITYRAHDAAAQRTVAIKEFFPTGCRRHGSRVEPDRALDTADYEAARSKFLEEARLLARFLAQRHPRIVEVRGAFAENNTAYLVMEYLEGKTLAQLLEARGALPQQDVMVFVAAVGEALRSVHTMGLLHRDVKPENVMLCDDGRIVLLDFGSARLFNTDGAGAGRRMTAMLTPGYAPLEQYGQQQQFGAHTDIYAFGATLYHLLTGQMPTAATDRAAGVELVPPDYLNNNVTQPVSRAIMWAMQMKIADRPQTVQAFLDALPLPQYSSSTAPAQNPAGTIARPRPAHLATTQSLDLGLPMVDGWFEVEVDTADPVWPQKCACCGALSCTVMKVGITPELKQSGSVYWPKRVVPYCLDCESHAIIGNNLTTQPFEIALLGGFIGFSIWICSFAFIVMNVDNGAMGDTLTKLFTYGSYGSFIIGMLGNHWLRTRGLQRTQAELKPTCTHLNTAVLYGGHQFGAHSYRFKNEQYAQEFRRLNPFPQSPVR